VKLEVPVFVIEIAFEMLALPTLVAPKVTESVAGEIL
jgi:hypothetical protein